MLLSLSLSLSLSHDLNVSVHSNGQEVRVRREKEKENYSKVGQVSSVAYQVSPRIEEGRVIISRLYGKEYTNKMHLLPPACPFQNLWQASMNGHANGLNQSST